MCNDNVDVVWLADSPRNVGGDGALHRIATHLTEIGIGMSDGGAIACGLACQSAVCSLGRGREGAANPDDQPLHEQRTS